MGKTKIKTIDDSVPVEETKVRQPKKTKKEEDSLVAKLNAELGIGTQEEPKSEAIEARSSENIGEEQTRRGPSGALRSDEAPTTKGKTKKPGKVKPRSKKYQEVAKDLDRTQTYPLASAIDMVKKLSYSKFNGSLEVHINTAQTGVRGLVSLPFASGKKLKILAFGPATSKQDSTEVVFGDDSTIEEIEKGQINFDLLITTPEWMPKLAKAAKVLGPKGLMPNPKNGTIVSGDALKSAVESFQTGKTEYKTEAKAPVIHLALGKLNQPNAELEANVKILLSSIGKTKIKKVSMTPTMGPSIKLDLSSI